eukprot:5630816-Pyramimonas_sp.AAC.1
MGSAARAPTKLTTWHMPEHTQEMQQRRNYSRCDCTTHDAEAAEDIKGSHSLPQMLCQLITICIAST